jgi:hypothetical protein
MRRLSLLIALVLCVTAATASADVPAVSIPNMPGQDGGPAFTGAAVRARPFPSFRVPEHPFMAPNGRSNIHNDAYMTDAYTQAGPLGRNTSAVSTWLGIEECASITFDSHDRIVGLCGTADGARLRMLDPTTLATIAVLPLPPRSYRPGTTPLTDFCAAGYFYLDRQDRGVLATNTNQIWVVGLRDPGAFVLEDVYDLNSDAPPPDCFVSVLPDWDGRIWFVSKAAVIGNVNPKTGGVQSVKLDGETVVNSFAVDDGDGVYVVTDHALYRFHADPKTDAPVQDWRTAYDRGTRRKPGMLSQGSGTTPTLMGSRYVSIADNADPRMHVEVYRRDTGKLVCREPVFAKGLGATENSLIAAGNSMFVENNYGYDGPASVDQGATSQPGLARVDFDPRRGTCRTVWTSREISPSTVAKASLGAGLLYAYAKPASDAGDDAWYFTAIDLRTGRTMWKVLTGTGYLFNNHYAPVSIGPDGAAYVGVLGGLLRIADSG